MYLSLVLNANAGISRIGAFDVGTAIRQDSLTHYLEFSSSNLIGNAGAQDTVKLYGCGNMHSPFQLVLFNDGSATNKVNVTIDSLTHGTDVIKNTGGTDPFDYTGRPIEFFVAHYQEVRTRTRFASDGGGAGYTQAMPGYNSADSLYFKGFLPNFLVPFEADTGTYTSGQGGAPFKIGASKSQGVFIDIFVPKNTPTGTYYGKVRVSVNGSNVDSMDIALRVYDVNLPDTTHSMNFMIGSTEGILNRYSGGSRTAGYYTMQDEMYMLCHRWRISYSDSWCSASTFSAHDLKFYSGSGYNAAAGYAGPGVGIGDNVYPIGAYTMAHYSGSCSWNGVSDFSYSQSGTQNAADAWEQIFLDSASATYRFVYTIDEPDKFTAGDSGCVQQTADWVHTSAGVGSGLHVFCNPEDNFTHYGNYLDTWAVAYPISSSGGFNINSGETQGANILNFIAAGGKAGIYNGERPAYGSGNLLDAPPTDGRMNCGWLPARYPDTVSFYYMWQSYYGGTDDASAWDVWADSFRVSDGNMLITGTDIIKTGSSRGLDGPVANISVWNWGLGAEDYELWYIAQQNAVDVSSTVNSVVPRAFNDYDAGDGFTTQAQQPVWAQTGPDYETARKALLDAVAPFSEGGSPSTVKFRLPFRIK